MSEQSNNAEDIADLKMLGESIMRLAPSLRGLVSIWVAAERDRGTPTWLAAQALQATLASELANFAAINAPPESDAALLKRVSEDFPDSFAESLKAYRQADAAAGNDDTPPPERLN